MKINIWRLLHTWRWPCRPKHVAKDSGNQHTIKLHADGDITCNTHSTIVCSRMLEYSNRNRILSRTTNEVSETLVVGGCWKDGDHFKHRFQIVSVELNRNRSFHQVSYLQSHPRCLGDLLMSVVVVYILCRDHAPRCLACFKYVTRIISVHKTYRFVMTIC
jgi:hypothetical protein